jgi:hypothetical protein
VQPHGHQSLAQKGITSGRETPKFLVLLITSSAVLFAAMPVVGQVIGRVNRPIVDRWLTKPSVNNQPMPATMGAFAIGEVEIGSIDEMVLDDE